MACNYCFPTRKLFQIHSEFWKKGIFRWETRISCLVGLKTHATIVPRSGLELTTSRLRSFILAHRCPRRYMDARRWAIGTCPKIASPFPFPSSLSPASTYPTGVPLQLARSWCRYTSVFTAAGCAREVGCIGRSSLTRNSSLVSTLLFSSLTVSAYRLLLLQ